jgi:hypothetical protein
VGVECKIPETQEALAGSNLLSLPCLPTRRISGRKLLIDYSHNHVMTSKEFLTIMQQKAIDREVVG